MTKFTRRATAALAVLFALAALAAPAQAQTKKQKRDQEIANYVKQLQARFNAWDKNDDNVLDKQELAKAFRGATAKPYDAGTDKTPPALKGTFDSTSLGLLAGLTPLYPRHGPAISVTLAVVLAKDFSSGKAPDLTKYNKLPDYQFLVLAGTSGQPKLTKKEFDVWAKQYAIALENVEEAERELKAANVAAQKAKTPQQKQKAAADLQRHTVEQNNARLVVQAVPPAIRQALNVKP